jgi:hypothetical protein
MSKTHHIAVKAPTPASNQKPGYRSTEFWLSTVAMVAGIILASSAIAVDSTAGQIVGGIVAVLALLGYTASRTEVKKAQGSIS